MLNIPPNWGIFFVLIVSFLVFWFIFKRLLFEPFLRLLADRERKFATLKEHTEQLIAQGQAAEERYSRELAEVQRTALAEREQQRRRAEEEVGRVIEEARVAARESIEKVRLEIERELEAAERQLGQLGHDLAVELAERVLGRSLAQGGPQVYSRN